MSNQNDAEKFLQETSDITVDGNLAWRLYSVKKYAELYHATRIAAVELPSDEEIEKYCLDNERDSDSAIIQRCKGAEWMRTEASKVIASKNAEIERLKQSVEYWKQRSNKATQLLERANSYFSDHQQIYKDICAHLYT